MLHFIRVTKYLRGKRTGFVLAYSPRGFSPSRWGPSGSRKRKQLVTWPLLSENETDDAGTQLTSLPPLSFHLSSRPLDDTTSICGECFRPQFHISEPQRCVHSISYVSKSSRVVTEDQTSEGSGVRQLLDPESGREDPQSLQPTLWASREGAGFHRGRLDDSTKHTARGRDYL